MPIINIHYPDSVYSLLADFNDFVLLGGPIVFKATANYDHFVDAQIRENNSKSFLLIVTWYTNLPSTSLIFAPKNYRTIEICFRLYFYQIYLTKKKLLKLTKK